MTEFLLKHRFPIQCFLSLGILALDRFRPELRTVTLLFLLVLIGLPHGSMDLALVKASLPKANHFSRVLGAYLLGTFFFGALYLNQPEAAVSLLLLFSVWHFGESLIWGSSVIKSHASRNQTQSIGKATIAFCTLGTLLVFTPFLFHRQETLEILAGIDFDLGSNLARFVGNVWPAELTWQSWGIGLLTLTSGVLLNFDRRARPKIWIQFALLLVVYQQASLWAGFGTYFLVWHSLTSLADQIEYLRSRNPAFSVSSYYVQGAPFWGPPVVVTLGWFALRSFEVLASLESPIGLPTLVIGLACSLTPPHLLTLTWIRLRASGPDKVRFKN